MALDLSAQRGSSLRVVIPDVECSFGVGQFNMPLSKKGERFVGFLFVANSDNIVTLSSPHERALSVFQHETTQLIWSTHDLDPDG